MDLSTLEKECLACTRCELCQTRTNVVFGQGVPNAEVLFVGEGPGQNEDEQGLPFVGRSGQLLDRYLFAIDLDRGKNCYIANIVKCRPPQNRDPLPAESEACMPWLREQFRILRPKIVVCLGRIASQRMIRQEFSVTKEHGRFVEKGGVWFMGTYHPAALLRSPSQKADAFGDFVALRDKIHEVCTHTYPQANG
jgi:DNA polymerase